LRWKLPLGVVVKCVGGPKWAGVPRDKRPEAGLLGLRAGMGVLANLRPALCFQPLADASSLKREVVEGLDFMIVRELTGGVYFGEPRFIEDLPGGGRRGVDTQVYTTAEIERVARVAFELARGRRQGGQRRKVQCDGSGLLWREVVTGLHRRDYAMSTSPTSWPTTRPCRSSTPSSSTCWSPTTCSATSSPTRPPS
jgi:3-isopropylmalate dehydrogenase